MFHLKLVKLKVKMSSSAFVLACWYFRERLVNGSCAQKRDHPFADLWSIYAIKMFTLAHPIDCFQDNIFNVIRKLFLISHKSQLQRQSKALESCSGKLFFKRFKYAFTFLKYTCELHFQIFSKLGSIFFFSAKPKQIQNSLVWEHIDEITFDKVHVIFYSFEKFQITIKRSE